MDRDSEIAQQSATAQPEAYYFEQTRFVPNSRLPVLVYRQVLPQPWEEDTAQAFLEKNQWLKGVREFHTVSPRKVHADRFRGPGALFPGIISTPILMNAMGSSTLLIGVGPDEDESNGRKIDVTAGDVIILPAGVSHCSKDFQDDYKYIGVYPKGSPKWKNEYCKDDSRCLSLRVEAESVDTPIWDPVMGQFGPLHTLWSSRMQGCF